MRIVNEVLLADFRRQPRCENCLRPTPNGADPAHYHARGLGGGSRLDVRINVAALCRECHSNFHAGAYRRRQMLELIALREKWSCDDIEREIGRLLKLPKDATAAVVPGDGGGAEAPVVPDRAPRRRKGRRLETDEGQR